jgi:hypothetical protein
VRPRALPKHTAGRGPRQAKPSLLPTPHYTSCSTTHFFFPHSFRICFWFTSQGHLHAAHPRHRSNNTPAKVAAQATHVFYHFNNQRLMIKLPTLCTRGASPQDAPSNQTEAARPPPRARAAWKRTHLSRGRPPAFCFPGFEHAVWRAPPRARARLSLRKIVAAPSPSAARAPQRARGRVASSAPFCLYSDISTHASFYVPFPAMHVEPQTLATPVPGRPRLGLSWRRRSSLGTSCRTPQDVACWRLPVLLCAMHQA